MSEKMGRPLYNETAQFQEVLRKNIRAALPSDDIPMACSSPMMLDAIYTLLFVLVVVLCVVGLFAVLRWADERVEALWRWHQRLSVQRRFRNAVDAAMNEINRGRS